MVKNLPAMQETWVWFPDQEGPLEKGMATHFSILAWRMPWTEEPNGLQSMGLQSQTRLSNFHLLTHTDNLASYLQLQVPGLFKKSFGGCFKNVDFF